MRRSWMIGFSLSMALLAACLAAPVSAQEGVLTISTPYPVREVAVGESVTFDLTLRTGSSPQTVRLDVAGLPSGWTATFRGGGDVIGAAYVEPGKDASIQLRVQLPQDVPADTYRFSVAAQGEHGKAEFPIELTVKEKVPASLQFEAELPTLRGTPSTTFRYDVTLRNEGEEDLSVNLLAEAPPEFEVTFTLGGQEVTTIPIAANESKQLSVEAKPYSEVSAGSYAIKVLAKGGEAEADIALTAEVTGQSELTVTAPDGRLSDTANVGQVTPLKVVVKNSGSAAARNIALSASQPSGWSVEFQPQQITEIAADQEVEVTANIKPNDKAVAGDYVVTIYAQPEDGSRQSADFRITVVTSTLWGVVGIGLIAVAVIVVGLAVMRFGRR
jgi:uncharacterized membrane protein